MVYLRLRALGRYLLILVLSCQSTVIGCPDAKATVVTVLKADGGKLIGQVDATTDQRHLVLRKSSAGVMLRTRIPWIALREIEIAGQKLTVSQFAEQIPELKSAGALSAFSGKSSDGNVVDVARSGPESQVNGRRGVATIIPDNSGALNSTNADSARVHSLQISTQPSNWDADAAIDGLLVNVQPLNDRGQIVAAEGRLNLKLVGLTETQGGQVQFGRSPVEFPVLETWDQPVNPTDFKTNGADYRLEFRRFDAERDIAVIPVGMVSARLSVPSVGTFTATENVTLLRPYNLIRDVHQQFRGTRQLPREFRD